MAPGIICKINNSVNVGCVPKKVMWNAASIAEALGDAESYGFKNVSLGTFDWKYLKAKRDAYIQRLNGYFYEIIVEYMSLI